MLKTKTKNSILTYKGRPFIRQGSTIYYGDMADKYIVLISVLESTEDKDVARSSKVSVQLQYTDPDLRTRDRVVKKSEKNGLYEAMDVGSIWLERALAE